MSVSRASSRPSWQAGSTGPVKLSVVVPVYNERYLVAELLRRVLAAEPEGVSEVEVVVVDDGSTDGTAEILEALAAEEPRLRLLRHERNAGKGAAVRTGVAACSGDLIVFQDADLEYDPRDYGQLVRPFLEDGADVVYGSRYLLSDRRRVLYFRHSLLNRVITFLSNLATDLTLSDIETCYKMFRAPLLKSIPIRSNDFAIEPEITAKIAKRHCRIFEVPISYLGRTYQEGKKIGWWDGLKALLAIGRFWILDDLYTEDAYGRLMHRRLERTPRFNRWLAETVSRSVQGRVLEVGAGIGSLTTWLLPRDLYVVADTDPNFLHFLRNLAAGRPYLRVDRIDPADEEFLERWEGQFDTVLCLGTVQQTGEPVAVLSNLRRALAPGGRLVLYVPQGERLHCALDVGLEHRRRYDRRGLARDLEAAGLEVESYRHFCRAGYPVWWATGCLLRRRRFGRLELKVFDLLIPLLRRIDRLLPWPGVGAVVVARAPSSGESAGERRVVDSAR